MMLQTVAPSANKSTPTKVDCAKECPCQGVPVIPVPDQWLEVMVTGGFKVWHIMFIIIAFVVTIVVVYCCFHRCRIPRTKQEIEADLIRMNITNKFRDYLQSMSKEPTNFLEALRRVQELEEKSEQDDAQLAREAAGRKRLGWLKLKGKGEGKEAEEPASVKEPEQPEKQEATEATTKEPPVATATVLPATAETEPKSAELSAVKPPEAGPAAGNEEPEKRTLRRRKQKPNLSRSKRARDTNVSAVGGDKTAEGAAGADAQATNKSPEEIDEQPKRADERRRRRSPKDLKGSASKTKQPAEQATGGQKTLEA